MNNEIKEILIKDFNEILVKEFCTDWKEKRLYIELLVNSTPFSNLLDYITNLQEENKELNDDNIWWNNRFKAVQRNYKDYKSRNEKAIEYVKSKKAIINTDYIRIFDLFKIDEQGYTDELLKILQGSDKE